METKYRTWSKRIDWNKDVTQDDLIMALFVSKLLNEYISVEERVKKMEEMENGHQRILS